MGLSLHRRHLDTCEHKAKGWNYTLCDCPIHCDGMLDGKRVRRSMDTTNWERAGRRIARLERGEDQDFFEPSRRRLGVSVDAYLADAQQRGLQASSLRSARRTLYQFQDTVSADIPLDAITVEHLSPFHARRVLSPRTQRKEIQQLRAFFSFCVSRQWLERNPAKLMKPPLIRDSPVVPYSDSDVHGLLNACEVIGRNEDPRTPALRKRCRALVMTLLYTGLRISDIIRLTRSSLEVTNHLVLRITKTGTPLRLQLKAEVADQLRALPVPDGTSKYFFWTGHGNWQSRSKGLWQTIATIGKIAEVHAHPHRFRHTFAVELLTNGKDIRTVQQLLGHESVKTTEKHYAHFVTAHQSILDEAVSSLDFSRGLAPRPLLVRPLSNGRRYA